MTTNKLIELLKQADPTGNHRVYVELLPTFEPEYVLNNVACVSKEGDIFTYIVIGAGI